VYAPSDARSTTDTAPRRPFAHRPAAGESAAGSSRCPASIDASGALGWTSLAPVSTTSSVRALSGSVPAYVRLRATNAGTSSPEKTSTCINGRRARSAIGIASS
jgi:hypothetical protein